MKKFSVKYIKFIFVLLLFADLLFCIMPLFFFLIYLHLIALAVLAVLLIVNIITSAIKKSWDKDFYSFYIAGTLGDVLLSAIFYHLTRRIF